MGKMNKGIKAYNNAMGKGEGNSGEDNRLLKSASSPRKNEKEKIQNAGLKKLIKNDIDAAPVSKIHRAAQFMVLIGSEEASKILSRLDSDQVHAISREIASIKFIKPEEAEAVLEEFKSLLSPSYSYLGTSKGGIEEARKHLYAAFGPDKGEYMLIKAVPEAAENPFDFLSDFSGEQIAFLFKNESASACALVFSRLPSKLSAAALAGMSPAKKLDIIKRIAKLKESPPDVIEQVAAAIKEKARYLGKKDDDVIFAGGESDGRGVLAAILKHSDISFGNRLLNEIEDDDPDLSKEMKDRLYTLDDVCNAIDRPIMEKLRKMDDREIALLIKGRSDEFIHKILSNLSVARAGRVNEESLIMGAVPKVEAEAAAREFLAWFRESREDGIILMKSGEDLLL